MSKSKPSSYMQRISGTNKGTGVMRNALSSYAVAYGTSDYTGDAALTLETVFACTARISQAVAALEIEAYRATGNGWDRISHSLKQLLNVKPASQISSFNWWENIVSDSLLWGAGYAAIRREGNTVTALDYLPASNVTKHAYQGNIFYMVTVSKEGRPTKFRVEEEDMFVVTSHRGVSPIRLHRETLDLAKNARTFGNDYFKNGGSMGGILEVPFEMNDEDYHKLQEMWASSFNGMGNHHGTPILEAGMQYKPISIPPDEAQFIVTRKYTDETIARIFQVPPSLIGLDTNVTFSNVEQQNIFFATYTIQPLVKRIENEIQNKLIAPRDAKSLRLEFDMSSLLRADASTRGSYYRTMANLGALTINEVREKEGFNPVEGGDTPLVQINQIPLSYMEEYAGAISDSNETPADSSNEDEAPTTETTEE